MKIIAIYRQEPTDDIHGCTILETSFGPKQYARICDDRVEGGGPIQIDWGWAMHETAIEVWRHPEHPEP